MSSRPERSRQAPTNGPSLVAYRARSRVKPTEPAGPSTGSAPAVQKRAAQVKAGAKTKAPTKAKTTGKTTKVKSKAKAAKKPPLAARKEKPLVAIPESTQDVGHDTSTHIESSSSPIIHSGDDGDEEIQLVEGEENVLDDSDGQDIMLEVPTLDGDVRMTVNSSTTYPALVRRVYAAIGCKEVKTKPILRAQTGANPKPKDSQLALRSDSTWEVVVEDALSKYKTASAGKGKKAQLERESQPRIKILLDDDYLRNLKHTRALSKASGGGNGIKKKKKSAPVDLNASDADEEPPSRYDLSDRQRNASKAVNAEYKSCKIGRCNGPCVRINDNLCTPVSQAMLSTLIDAIANEMDGVSVKNPPQTPMFEIWPGRAGAAHMHNNSPPRRTQRRPSDRFSPYRSSHRHSYRERSPAYPQSSSTRPARSHSAPMVAINSTAFTSLPDPSILEFLTALHETPAYARRKLDQLIPFFETRDFYSISALANYNDLELIQRVPEVSAGNASFIVSAIAQYLRSVPP